MATNTEIRIAALEQAVHAAAPNERADETTKRAQAYFDFLVENGANG